MRWANALADRGVEIHIATQHPSAHGYDQRITMYALPHRNGLGYLLNRGRLQEIVDRVEPDLVNVHYATGYGTLASALERTCVVLNVWGSDVFEFPKKSFVHRWLVVRNLRRAHQLVSTSEAMAKQVRTIMRREVPIVIVPFGVDTSIFEPGVKGTEGPLVVGTVKTLAPIYGIDVLLRAFALVPERIAGRGVVLRIVGKGPQEAQLRALCSSLKLDHRVDLAGAVAHARVPEALAGMDVFVALSRSESFGVAVIEASACGLPVVVSDVGGLPEVVDHGVTGLVVPANDPQAAAQAIMRLLADAELRKSMGSAGRAWMERSFRWEDCVDRMMAVYKGNMQRQ